jgi:hypothetical protein
MNAGSAEKPRKTRERQAPVTASRAASATTHEQLVLYELEQNAA